MHKAVLNEERLVCPRYAAFCILGAGLIMLAGLQQHYPQDSGILQERVDHRARTHAPGILDEIAMNAQATVQCSALRLDVL